MSMPLTRSDLCEICVAMSATLALRDAAVNASSVAYFAGIQPNCSR